MLLLRDFFAALKQGAKITPNELAGFIGLPHVGNLYYLDATNGSDTANGGEKQDDAFATVGTAEDNTTNNNHDVIIVTPGGTGSGTGTSETANIGWDKSLTHIVGNAAPSFLSQRSRLITSTDAVDPCWTISGQGCMFANLQIATYQASNDVLVSLTGNRNVFHNVHFAGIGHATAGDDATARCISASGAEENLFNQCYIGLDTVARSTTNAEIEFASGCTRNMFKDCIITGFADNNGHLFFKAASAADVDRWVLFEDTSFINPVGSTATTMTVGMSIHASVGGLVLLKGKTSMVGATDLADDFTNLRADGLADGGTTAATANLMLTNA